MKAPSEKHLEDWIVANPKWFGDRWDRFDDPYGFTDNFIWIDDNNFIWPILSKVISRQPRFPTGIPDLIGLMDDRIAVIELKKGIIDSKVIAQCLRYMSALKKIQHWTYTNRGHGIDWRTLDPDADNEIVSGLIVGHTIKDENLQVVAKHSSIQLYTYDYVEDQNLYTFHHQNFIEPVENDLEYIDWANGAVGDAILNATHSWLPKSGGKS